MERIGIGYDIHRLVEGRKLILGGVEIPFEKGLLGHSDADVLTHAVCDALLGALGKGDIGEHFPDTDSRYKDVSSLSLLKKVMEWVGREGYAIVNLDTIVIAEKPNLKSVKPDIRATLARHLFVKEEAINIKAKTTEGLGFGPNGEDAIAAHVIVLLSKKEE
ncbi:MAG: 2-C-methyl-D-erythritol 2,4-cyclodiphosphate synthase [Candidatus Omnitrophica bacterium]|nr:2-C-methyl-D-erythritol 2,4-cyclodiphosphate synthase [Candidatus Omnitrophota bacterium]